MTGSTTLIRCPFSSRAAGDRLLGGVCGVEDEGWRGEHFYMLMVGTAFISETRLDIANSLYQSHMLYATA